MHWFRCFRRRWIMTCILTREKKHQKERRTRHHKKLDGYLTHLYKDVFLKDYFIYISLGEENSR